VKVFASAFVLSFSLILVAVHHRRRQAALAQMRTKVVSSVSHELRTPLAQSQLFLEVLRLGRCRNDRERDWVFDNMQRELARLMSLVNNVLHSHQSSETHCPRQRDKTLSSRRISMKSPMGSSRSRQCRRTQSRRRSKIVSVQPDRLRQVMLNLLDNAVTDGSRGQTIRITTLTLDGSVRIIVEDEGKGIAPGDIDRIWAPYQRGANAGGPVGTGIGLSVVRDVVGAHGGDVSIERPSTGASRFIITLPKRT
jgi:signal transduction histidine kinase